MRASFGVVIFVVFSSGCVRELDDIQDYIAEVKTQTPPSELTLPQMQTFTALTYHATDYTDPFVVYGAAANVTALRQPQRCLAPLRDRRKTLLAAYPLDSLRMRGSYRKGSKRWGLIQSADGKIHSVSINDYLGLSDSRVSEITATYIELTELVPAESGCWTPRVATIRLVDTEFAMN